MEELNLSFSVSLGANQVLYLVSPGNHLDLVFLKQILSWGHHSGGLFPIPHRQKQLVAGRDSRIVTFLKGRGSRPQAPESILAVGFALKDLQLHSPLLLERRALIPCHLIGGGFPYSGLGKCGPARLLFLKQNQFDCPVSS